MADKTLGSRDGKRKKFSWNLNFSVNFKCSIKYINGNVEDNLKYLKGRNLSWRDFHSSGVINQCLQ